jgi:purine-binding chemotaxis protein CheW
MSTSQQYCTFHLGPLFLGVEVLKVQEVIRRQTMTRVPLAPAAVSGLINLRGQIVTAIDLRQRLGLPDRPADREPMNVVVRTDEGVVSLLVDEIGDVIEPSGDTFERPPETLDERARSLVRGVYKLPDRLLLVFDTERALAVEPVGAGAGR